MLEKDSPYRSHSVPLGHKFLAVLFAAAIAFGAHTWLTRTAAGTAGAAEMSFDPKTARHIDTGLGDAPEPAVATAQFILSDQVVEGLAKPAFLASSGMTTRVGEFRSRLEFTQPGPGVLDVSFRDQDPARSIATTNAVADALANWSPSFSAPAPSNSSAPTQPAPSASPSPVSAGTPAASTPAAAPPPTRVKKPAPPRQEESSSGLAAALGQLEDQLSSTDRQLSSSRSGDLPSYTQSRQQQLIKSRVREAEQQLRDLRTKYPTERRLGSIQQELSSVIPEKVVGVSSARLREERVQLTYTIATIESVRVAVQHEESARNNSSPDEAASAPAPEPAPSAASEAAQSPAAPVSESNIGQSAAQQPPASDSAPAPSPLTAQSEPGPLAVVRLAGTAMPVPWWPSAAGGAACGLLYFTIVAVRYRRLARAYETAYDEEATPSFQSSRFITPDAPIAAREEREPREPSGGEYASLVPHEPAPHRASFTWDATPEEPREAPSRRASFSYDPGPHPHREASSPLENNQPQSETAPAQTGDISAHAEDHLPQVADHSPRAESAAPDTVIVGPAVALTSSAEELQEPVATYSVAEEARVDEIQAAVLEPSHPVEIREEAAHELFYDVPLDPVHMPVPEPVQEAVQQPVPTREAHPDLMAAYASAPEPVAQPRVADSPLADSPRKAGEEPKPVPVWDTWADNLKKSLSQTEIGRRFEGVREREPDPSEAEMPIGSQRSSRDRMAG